MRFDYVIIWWNKFFSLNKGRVSSLHCVLAVNLVNLDFHVWVLYPFFSKVFQDELWVFPGVEINVYSVSVFSHSPVSSLYHSSSIFYFYVQMTIEKVAYYHFSFLPRLFAIRVTFLRPLITKLDLMDLSIWLLIVFFRFMFSASALSRRFCISTMVSFLVSSCFLRKSISALIVAISTLRADIMSFLTSASFCEIYFDTHILYFIG